MNTDEYLNSLIAIAQDLTRQLAEVEARIKAHENRLDGEFLSPFAGHFEAADSRARHSLEMLPARRASA